MAPLNQLPLADFIQAAGVTMTVRPADSNPNISDDKWARTATHWRCYLKVAGRRMNTYFSQGSAHGNTEPELKDVLDCLASDARCVDGVKGFEGWASELGYDADSRSAKRTYDNCVKGAAALKRTLGDAEYERLLYDVESL